MDELILGSISVGVQRLNSRLNFCFSPHWESMREERGACSRPDADVIDGVENTTPPARWPLLAQMVCNLTKRGHWKSEGRLQGSRAMWVVSVSGAGQHYNRMLLPSFSRISTFQVYSLKWCQFETRGHLFAKFCYVFKHLPHLVVTRGIKGGDDFMLHSGSARICRYTPWSTVFFHSAVSLLIQRSKWSACTKQNQFNCFAT